MNRPAPSVVIRNNAVQTNAQYSTVGGGGNNAIQRGAISATIAGGFQNVIASADCGFGTSAVLDEVHTDVAWAKIAALGEGAKLASKELWKN